MKTKAIVMMFAAGMLAGCVSKPATQNLTDQVAAPLANDLTNLVPPAQSGQSSSSALPVQTWPQFRLSWTAPLSPHIAYYEVQQTTNILSTNFFDLTNVVGITAIVLATNQSGTWRIRTVNTNGIPSAWAYLKSIK